MAKPKVGLPRDVRGQELMKLLARDRYERYLNKEIEKVLLAHFEEVTRLLLADPMALDGAHGARLAAMFTRALRILKTGYDTAEKFHKSETLGYVGVEAQAAKAQLRGLLVDTEAYRVSMGNLTRAELRAIVTMPIEGLTLGEWWKKQAHDMSILTRQQIQLGIVAGEGPRDIARRLVPTDTKPAVLRQAVMRTRMLTRTTLTTVQNEAAFQSYASAGPDVSQDYTYVAVKDNRTSTICRALDGNIYKYNDPNAVLPPQHINCRSTIVPNVNHSKLGLPAPKDGSVLSFRSYSAWLTDQSNAQQDAVLGPSRGAMFRAGDVSLERLVGQDNKVLTLDELRAQIGEVKVA